MDLGGLVDSKGSGHWGKRRGLEPRQYLTEKRRKLSRELNIRSGKVTGKFQT